MTQRDYVTSDVADMLKIKGFRENSQAYYHFKKFKWCLFRDGVNYNGLCYAQHTSAPSLAQATKWLRSKNIEVASLYCRENNQWFYMISLMNSITDLTELNQDKFSPSFYNSYEEALNKGIKEALKMI